MGLSADQLAQYDETQRPLIVGVLVSMLVLSNASLALRLYFVVKRRSNFLWEDYAVITAQILSDGIAGALIVATSMGFGLHQYRVLAEDPDPPLAIVRIQQITWAYAVLNNLCLLAIKMSILLFYRRLFRIQPWFRIAWWINVAYAVFWTIGTTLFYIFQCTPVDFYWTRLGALVPDPPFYVDPNGHCTSGLGAIGTPILLSTLGDVAILLLPIPVVFKLQTAVVKRLRLSLLFSVGALAAASGFVRFAMVFSVTSDRTCKSTID